MFSNTTHIDLPTWFTGLRIERGRDGRYVVSGDGWQGEVTAENVADREADGEYFDPGPFGDAFLQP